MSWRVCWVCWLVVAAGCSVDRAGLAETDGGPPPPVDLGSTSVDLGSIPVDLGSTPLDLGPTPVDLGPPPPDLGPPPPDLGPPACAILGCPGRRCTAGVCSNWTSCQEIHAADGDTTTSPTGTYPLSPPGPTLATYMAFCEMVADGGGWTLVLKGDGADTSTFSYAQPVWTNATTLRPDSIDYTRTQAKLDAYLYVQANELRVGFQTAGSGDGVSATYGVFDPPDKSSFQQLMMDGAPTIGSDTMWLGLIAGSDVQHHFRQTGANVLGDLRLGVVGDESTMMSRSPDSFLGIGANPAAFGGLTVMAGNWARFNTTAGGDGDHTTPAFAFVFVR